MNRFLFEKFPRSYSRIYKAMIQNDAKHVLPNIIKYVIKEKNIDSVIDGSKKINLSRDIEDAIASVVYITKCGYAGILELIVKDWYGMKISGSLDAIVLQIDESQRWRKKFGTKSRQFDLILAIPKWSRVVSLSTSEIIPYDLVEKIRQFDTIKLENYHFYEVFNKLHGVSGRKVTVSEQSDNDRACNLSKLTFVFRTIRDVVMLSKSMNVRMLTIVPDINGEPRMGFYFTVFCNIDDVKEASGADGVGINPYSFELTVSDGTGNVNMVLDASNFTRTIRNGYLANEINGLFNSKLTTHDKFDHPFDMKGHSKHFIITGNWFLGDDRPNITYMAPLSSNVDHAALQLIGFANTRKKIPMEEIRSLLYGTRIDIKTHENIIADLSGKFILYKERHWDYDVFKIMIERKFSKMKFSDLVMTGQSIAEFRKADGYFKKYFEINPFIKDLYLSDDPEDGVLNAYPQFGTTQEDSVQSAECELISDLAPVYSWSKIKKYIPRIEEEGIDIEEIFEWFNGGKILSRKSPSRYKYTDYLEYLTAVIRLIYVARGRVWLPNKITEEK